MDFNVGIQLFKLIVTRKLNLLFVTSWGSLIWDSIWTNEIIWYNLIALNPTTTSCLRKTRVLELSKFRFVFWEGCNEKQQ